MSPRGYLSLAISIHGLSKLDRLLEASANEVSTIQANPRFSDVGSISKVLGQPPEHPDTRPSSRRRARPALGAFYAPLTWSGPLLLSRAPACSVNVPFLASAVTGNVCPVAGRNVVM